MHLGIFLIKLLPFPSLVSVHVIWKMLTQLFLLDFQTSESTHYPVLANNCEASHTHRDCFRGGYVSKPAYAELIQGYFQSNQEGENILSPRVVKLTVWEPSCGHLCLTLRRKPAEENIFLVILFEHLKSAMSDCPWIFNFDLFEQGSGRYTYFKSLYPPGNFFLFVLGPLSRDLQINSPFSFTCYPIRDEENYMMQEVCTHAVIKKEVFFGF